MDAAKEKSWTAVTYAQDFSEEGAALGPQTILRLKRIVEARNEGYTIKAIALAGGIGPETPKYPKQTRPFAIMMEDWLVAEGKFPRETIYCDVKSWNCIEATMGMIRLIKENRLSQNVLVISTGRHLFPRMWTTWTLLCGGRKDWSLGFIPEWKGAYDLLHELGGTIKYIPMSLWHRWKI
jgi:hypothetical protein